MGRRNPQQRKEYLKQYYRKHQEVMKEGFKRRKEKLRQKGLCIDCGKPSLGGFVRCGLCLYKTRIRGEKYRERNREYLVIMHKEERKRWLGEGKCYRCGVPLIEDETKYCIACIAHNRQEPLIKGVLV